MRGLGGVKGRRVMGFYSLTLRVVDLVWALLVGVIAGAIGILHKRYSDLCIGSLADLIRDRSSVLS